MALIGNGNSLDIGKEQLDMLKDLEINQCIDINGNVTIGDEKISMKMSVCRITGEEWTFRGENDLGDDDPIVLDATVKIRDLEMEKRII